MDALALEWKLRRPSLNNRNIVSVYFGGGTPSLLGPAFIAEILSWVDNRSLDCEITLEANPEEISLTLMQEFASAGINRVSIGIQSLKNSLLVSLQRTHDAKKGINAVHETFKAGLSNISIDLMYDLPGQTLEDWQETLKQAVDLPIHHLSLYNLTIEPHTSFYKRREELKKSLPPEEVSLCMHRAALETLEMGGLKQYEISAFARNQHYSLHNIGYWSARPFLGLGPSAFSYWNNKRSQNIPNLSKYAKSLNAEILPVGFEEELDEDARRRELLAIQLRLVKGVNLPEFEAYFGNISPETHLSIFKLIEDRLLIKQADRIFLSPKGNLFYDSVAVEII